MQRPGPGNKAVQRPRAGHNLQLEEQGGGLCGADVEAGGAGQGGESLMGFREDWPLI